jgi:ribosomal subunit interface protein
MEKASAKFGFLKGRKSMSIHIAGHQMDVGESLNTFVETELKALLEKYVGEIYESHVHLSKDHHEFVTDLAVHVSKNLAIHSKGQAGDAYKSFGDALSKLETRIKKYRSRLRDRKRHSDVAAISAMYSVFNHESEDNGADTPVIIAEMAHDIHHLTVSEAVMKLDLGDSPVIMFKNAANNQLNVVYRRKDGNIGWIDPTKCSN